MPRNQSIVTKRNALREETGSAVFYLLEITHESLPDPIRFVQNNEPVVKLGETWLPADFDIQMPTENTDALSRASIAFENIDRVFLKALTSILTPLIVRVWVTASDDDIPVAGPVKLTWRETSWDAAIIRGSLEPVDMLNQNFPKDEFNPSKFPGLFK